MKRIIPTFVTTILLLTVPAGAALTVHQYVSGEKVVCDNETGKHWYWKMSDFNDMNTPEQFEAIGKLNPPYDPPHDVDGYGGFTGGWHMATKREIERLFDVESKQTDYNDLELPWWWYEAHPHTPELLEITKNFDETYDGGSHNPRNWWGRVNWVYQFFPWDPMYYETVRLTKYISTFSQHEGYPDNYKDDYLGAWVTTDQTPAHVLFVREKAAGAKGRSWDDAFGTLQEALEEAQKNPVPNREIWVAEGTYRPGNPGDSRANAFWMIKGVKIYGGFPKRGSSNEAYPCFCDRDPQKHVTTLSGDLNGDDDGTGTKRADNCYHVINNDPALALDASAVLDGFVITAGNANVGTGFNFDVGGGMYNVSSHPTVTSCRFIGNNAIKGGGMYNESSNPTVINCEFNNNFAIQDGGGMYNTASAPSVVNCTVSANKASDGGGMYNSGNSNAVVANCIFWGNSPTQITAKTGSGATVVNYSDVQGGWSGHGGNNKDDNPRFVDAYGPDGLPGTVDDDLHLLPGSPCIDAGKNTSLPLDTYDLDQDHNKNEWMPYDVRGNPRLRDDPNKTDSGVGPAPIVDMGACEVMGVEKTLNPGQTETLIPNGGSGEPTQDAQVRVQNGGIDKVTVKAAEYNADLHQKKHAFEVSGTTLVIELSPADAAGLFMTIKIPFRDNNSKGSDKWKKMRLKYWDGANWVQAIRGNAAAHVDEWPPAMPAPERESLNQHGVYWNSLTKKGFVWANVDHATDFAAAWLPGDFEPNGGVDFVDFARMSAAWLSDDSPSAAWDPLCDLDDNGVINADDLAIFTARWLVGK